MRYRVHYEDNQKILDFEMESEYSIDNELLNIDIYSKVSKLGGNPSYCRYLEVELIKSKGDIPLDKAVDEAIELILSENSKVLDNPDIWGRWLNVNQWGHVAYFDVIEKEGVFYAETEEGTQRTDEIGGQWIHVLLETGKD